MRAAADTAARLGYGVHVVDEPTTGAARSAGPALVARGLTVALSRPACIIATGETTVNVRGDGRGGRNQELALSALGPLAGAGICALASIGTDGIDGPTDAAGALVSGDMLASLGPTAGDRIARSLAANDSYPLLDELHALVRMGPTGTNVGDLQVLLLV
jgi:glycerate-2-kinase